MTIAVGANPFEQGKPARLTAAAGLSLLLHVSVVAIAFGPMASVWRAAAVHPAVGAVDSDDPQKQERRDPLELGLVESKAVSINWLGFAERPEEHLLDEESELDQAALTQEAAGQPGEPAPVEPVAMEPKPEPEVVEPVEVVREEPVEVAAAEQPEAAQELVEPEPIETVAVEPVQAETERPVPETARVEAHGSETEPAPVSVETDVVEGEREKTVPIRVEPIEAGGSGEGWQPTSETVEAEPVQAESVQPLPETAQVEARDSKKKPAAQPVVQRPVPNPWHPRAPSRSGGGTTRGPGAGNLPGEQSDRDATPTSRVRTFDLTQWGRPLASEGLELMPSAPQIPIAQRYVLRRTVVIIDMAFDRTGRVRRADFARIPGKNGALRLTRTLNKIVDEALIDSAFRWRAKGPPLEQIAAGDTLTVRVRIMLR